MKKILSVIIFMLCCCPIYSHAAWYDAEFEELKARNFINEVHFQNPDTPILREEICDILISLYKYQNPDSIIEEKANNFTDIQGSAYSSSIASAYSLGMIQGVSDAEFQGKGTLTREQFATIVYRMHGSPMAPVRLYRDEPEISDYAFSGIDYCVQQGIVKGTQKDFFSPKKALTKAEALAMVNRICKLENSTTKENAQLTTTVIEDSVAVYIIGYNYTQERSFDTLEGAAKNESSNSAQFMGAGIGFGMGMGLGGNIGQSFGNMANNINTTPTKECPHCKKQIGFDFKFCPECGNDTSVATGTTCPKCGNINPIGTKYCCSCGTPISKVCSKCGETLSNEEKFCHNCGTPIVKKCECGYELSDNLKFCPECGRKVNGDKSE